MKSSIINAAGKTLFILHTLFIVASTIVAIIQ
jgi:hypothetical protein